jgi:hypothetical protein
VSGFGLLLPERQTLQRHRRMRLSAAAGRSRGSYLITQRALSFTFF